MILNTLVELEKAIVAGERIEHLLVAMNPGDPIYWKRLDTKRATLGMVSAKLKCGHIRIVAELALRQPIDLSVLADSGIDCVFWNHDSGNERYLGVLKSFQLPLKAPDHKPYLGDTTGNNRWTNYHYCQPRIGYWYNWQGGKCPLPEGLMIEIITRDEGTFNKTLVNAFRWSCDKYHASGDIIAFKILPNLVKGYCWPWEKKA